MYKRGNYYSAGFPRIADLGILIDPEFGHFLYYPDLGITI